MKFQDILPHLLNGVNFKKPNWAQNNTYISRSSDGYIQLIWKGGVDTKKWAPNAEDIYEVEWVSTDNKPLAALTDDYKPTNLFALLKDATENGYEVASENVTETVDFAFFNRHGNLVFETLVGNERVPCEPGLEMFTKTDWAIRPLQQQVEPETPVSNVIPEPALGGGAAGDSNALEQPIDHNVLNRRSDEVEEPVLERTNTTTTEPPVRVPDAEAFVHVQLGWWSAVGPRGPVVGEVVHQCAEGITLETLSGVEGSRETTHLTHNLFDQLFAPVPWLSVGVELTNLETGTRVIVASFDPVSVLVAIPIAGDIVGDAEIPKEDLSPANWKMTGYNPNYERATK